MKRILPLLFVSVLFLESCVKDMMSFDKLTSTEWNPQFAIPVVNSRLDVYRTLANADTSDLIIIDPNTGLLALIYEGTLVSYNAQDIVKLPDTTYSKSYTMPFGNIGPFQSTVGATYTMEETFDFVFAPNAETKIDSIILKSGFLDLNISSDFMHSAMLNVSIPGLKKDGVAFSKNITINYVASTPVTSQNRYDLTGYTFDMTKNGSTFNTLQVIYSAVLTSSGNPVSSSDNFTITKSLSGMAFSRVYGYFGQKAISIDTDSVNLRIFNSAINGYFELTDPKIKVIVDNSFGFPLDVTFTQLNSVNMSTGQVTPIMLSGFPNPFSVNYPSVSEVGSTKVTNLQIDKSNSNVNILINPTPKYIVHTIEAVSNPDGAPTSSNFITDQSKMTIRTEVELPLVGFGKNLIFQDTLPMALEGSMFEQVESILFRINIDNGFPFNAEMQLYFTDENFVVIDSLMGADREIIASAPVDANGRSSGITNKTTDITYDRERAEKFFNAKYAIVWAKGNTPNSQNNSVVKFYEDYFMNVRLGMNVKAGLKLN